MKHLLLLGVALLLISSCAGVPRIPEPEGAGNSLVVGSLILSFPDGFFDLPSRQVESGVVLNVRNLTKDSAFAVMTGHGGMYCFLTNGTDDYALESFEYKEGSGAGSYTLGTNPLGAKFTATRDRVLYTAHITVTYAKGTLYRDYGSGGTTWDFKKSLAAKLDKDAVLAYLKEGNPTSAWLSREMVVVTFQAAK